MLEVVGHEREKQFLEKAQSLDRVPSGLAFIGKEGIGKKKLALAFARGLLCKEGKPFGCGECKNCRLVNRFIEDLYRGEEDKYAYYTEEEGKKHFSFLLGEHPDLVLVPPDGTQIKIDQIRDLKEYLSVKGTGKYRVVIIDQAGKMNLQAQNALLKILEEPPEGTVFILIANNKGELLPTILSRCQVLEFKPLRENEIKEILGKLNVKVSPALEEMLLSEGSLSLLSLSGEEIGGLLERLSDFKNLSFADIVEISETFEKFDTEKRETFLGLLENFLLQKAVKKEIPLETFERVSKIIADTKKGLKRGIKAKLAMEVLLLTLRD